MNDIKIEQLKSLNKKDYHDCMNLLPQLLPTVKLPSYAEFEKIIKSPTTNLFIAREESSQQIIGMLTLIFYRIPVGLCSRIEDVIIDENHRRKGLGTSLCNAAIEDAKKAEAMKIDLTSNPSREEAHRLYESLGFSIYNTSVYRLVLH
ncbi:TPA: GNAT family N-acetyltransferase [Candidatus Berkelbacteria bacterium]|uniref:Acetyltransferase n=1 Tax=Berkelbacteria bacterium GW2011_GWE1_39_12 TaxID=1618337 RepID=A0A0G4B3K0_9BACT|nr:MAG: acetyltransferase [Berkelbacteria bacterium GW2011_GWE1_39_12]HBO60732.1 GNAT family N-acetyltransferase [Candidatus Berkelbacteria bacterium]